MDIDEQDFVPVVKKIKTRTCAEYNEELNSCAEFCFFDFDKKIIEEILVMWTSGILRTTPCECVYGKKSNRMFGCICNGCSDIRFVSRDIYITKVSHLPTKKLNNISWDFIEWLLCEKEPRAVSFWNSVCGAVDS